MERDLGEEVDTKKSRGKVFDKEEETKEGRGNINKMKTQEINTYRNATHSVFLLICKEVWRWKFVALRRIQSTISFLIDIFSFEPSGPSFLYLTHVEHQGRALRNGVRL